MKVITTITLCIGKGKDRRYVEPGTEVDLAEGDAEVLLNRGHARAATSSSATTGNTPSLEDIADAIDQLDKQKDFKDGIPNLKALERVLKATITTALRDEAWAKVQADRKAVGQ